jgi:hypothetical protein
MLRTFVADFRAVRDFVHRLDTSSFSFYPQLSITICLALVFTLSIACSDSNGSLSRLELPTHLTLNTEDVPVQVLIAELALRIVLPASINKLRHLLVNTPQFRRRRCKQLSPVGPRMKRG